MDFFKLLFHLSLVHGGCGSCDISLARLVAAE